MNLEQSRQLAQNKTTQPKTLAELAEHEDSLVREDVACNPNAPVEVLEKLGEEFPDAIVTNPIFDLLLLENPKSKFILLSLARASTTSVEILKELADRQDKNIREAVVINRKTPISLINKIFAEDREREIKESVAKHPKTSKELLYNLAKENSFYICRAIANRENIPEEVIEILIQSGSWNASSLYFEKCDFYRHPPLDPDSWHVRDLIASHLNISKNLIDRLIEDEHHHVRAAIAAREDISEKQAMMLAGDLSDLVRKKLADNPKVSNAVKKLSNIYSKRNPNISVREKIARSSKISQEIIEELARDSVPLIRIAIAENPQTPQNILDELERERNFSVRRAIALRQDISEKVGRELAYNLAENVRQKLAKNTSISPEVVRLTRKVARFNCTGIKAINIGYLYKKSNRILKLNNRIIKLQAAIVAQNNSYYTKRLLMSDPNTPIEIIQQLSKDADSSIRIRVAQNINTPSQILEIFATDENYLVRQCVANHPQTKLKTLNILKTDNNINVREKVAANSNISIEIIQELAQDSMAAVRQAIVNNPQTTTAILNDLKSDRSDCVRGAIAIREDIPEEIAVALADDTSAYVRQRLVCNPNIPVKIIELLSKDIDSISKDGNSLVQIEMIKNINLSPKLFENLALSSAAKVRQEVARHPKAPLSVLDRLKTDKDKYVRVEVAKNPNISLAIMEYLAKDSINSKPTSHSRRNPFRVWDDYHHQVRLAIARRNDITEKVASILSKDSLPQVRWTVANNVKVPLNIIIFLSEDSNQKVQDEAIKMLMNRQKAENIDEL